jgi:surface polysaccharide O-acyltransferase-like enzyme
MISGANLLDYRSRYSTAVFFKKRFWKAVFPFLIWSVVGMFYCMVTTDMSGYTLGSLLLGIVNTEYVQVYWFFIPLFMVYLAMPLFSDVEHKKEVYGFLILAGLLLNAILPWIAALHGVGYNDLLRLSAVSGYLIFILIGYYLDHYELPPVARIVIYILGIYGLWYLTAKTLQASNTWETLWTWYKGYTNLPTILYSSAIFLAFKNIRSEKVLALLDKVCRPLSGVTFGVYLIHRGLIEMVYLFTEIDTDSLSYRLVGTFVIFGISALLVKGMQHIPGLRRIVP